jgi:hypothetical protein
MRPDLTITAVHLTRFHTITRKAKDADGHDHPCDPRETVTALLSVETDAGVTGQVLCPPAPMREELIFGHLDF